MKYTNSYIIRIQYLGFRFHGWQKQKGLKTVHDIVDKTLSFVFGHINFKTFGVGRTDAKVSALNYPLQLFINEELDFAKFIKSFNKNTVNDVHCLKIEKCDLKYSIINSPKIKEYHYYFSFGKKQHPFSAPLIVSLQENLDIEMMKKGAKIFEGIHFFDKYCTKPKENTILKRKIEYCRIIENKNLTANFFPEISFVLRIKSKGFLRNQIRLIMAILFELGKGNIDLEFIKNSLVENNDKKSFNFIAQASGLLLYDVKLL